MLGMCEKVQNNHHELPHPAAVGSAEPECRSTSSSLPLSHGAVPLNMNGAGAAAVLSKGVLLGATEQRKDSICRHD